MWPRLLLFVTRRSAPFFLLGFAAACSRDVTETVSPPIADRPALKLAPGKGAEQPGFAFLAPIGLLAPRLSDAEFDGTLLPKLRVEVCEWTGTACRVPLVKTFAAGSGLTVIDAEYRNLYRAFWQAPIRLKDLGKIFRIRVLAGTTELGHADLELVRWLTILTDGEPLIGGGKVGLGAIVPIRFYVAKGAITAVTPAGGVVEMAGGSVKLEVPAGAVSGPTTFSVTPATDLPTGGPAIVPGTAWDFGPDGITFERPVTMTIRYDPALLPAGASEADLRIHKLVDGAYQQQNAGVVDLVNKTVSARVNGFSVYVVLPRQPGAEDRAGPVVTAVEIQDPVTGAWGQTATFDANVAAMPYRVRVLAEDNIAGVRQASISFESPSGLRFRNCFVTGTPVSGSDTHGIWECGGSFPRYLEPGVWRLRTVTVSDAAGNFSSYLVNDQSLFCHFTNTADCLSSVPTAIVVANPFDVTAPVVRDSVSLSTDPQSGVFARSVSVDVATTSRTVTVRVPFADDLSGLQPGLTFIRFDRIGGGVSRFAVPCQVVVGDALSGELQCPLLLPELTQEGTYRIGSLIIEDSAGNRNSYGPQADGRLCTTGNLVCLPFTPAVEVISLGDGEPPALESVAVSVQGSEVTTTVGVRDDIAGVARIVIAYRSAETTQVQQCELTPPSSTTVLMGCTIAFPFFAAGGRWDLSVIVSDRSGNSRRYQRRAADGFLCYTDPGASQVCQDFGDTDLMIVDGVPGEP